MISPRRLTQETTETPSAKAKPASPSTSSGCGTKATNDCTPHINLGGSLRVDAMIWKVKSVSTATQIGDQQYGLGQKADGKVVFDVPESVLSKKVEMRFNELGFGTTHGYIDISSQLG